MACGKQGSISHVETMEAVVLLHETGDDIGGSELGGGLEKSDNEGLPGRYGGKQHEHDLCKKFIIEPASTKFAVLESKKREAFRLDDESLCCTASASQTSLAEVLPLRCTNWSSAIMERIMPTARSLRRSISLLLHIPHVRTHGLMVRYGTNSSCGTHRCGRCSGIIKDGHSRNWEYELLTCAEPPKPLTHEFGLGLWGPGQIPAGTLCEGPDDTREVETRVEYVKIDRKKPTEGEVPGAQNEFERNAPMLARRVSVKHEAGGVEDDE
ncbi:hypothetical protein K438DRAFT_2047790 [Mycena galopus ATCC 62051]|nr:hypothetical protein K438DRAFT_2047790 [Mycena galopus ATCC 62051]